MFFLLPEETLRKRQTEKLGILRGILREYLRFLYVYGIIELTKCSNE